ncbi:MAG: hypothetical protein J6P93_04645 [Alphaproteobacteria bacterium]|nr:hypothetical protein [Alphaproteobacteria bacterium]
MVKYDLRQIILCGLGVLAILFVVLSKTSETSWERSKAVLAEKRNHYTVEVTEKELQEFIKFWPEFKQIGLFSKKDVSYSALRPSENVNWIMRFWFVYHQMDAERFFYVRQRLIYLLQALDIKRNAEEIIEQMEDRNDALSQQMIELQKSRINALKMAFEELLLVSAYEDKLREIFKKYP